MSYIEVDRLQIEGMVSERNRRQRLVEQVIMSHLDSETLDDLAGGRVLSIEIDYDTAVAFLQEFSPQTETP